MGRFQLSGSDATTPDLRREPVDTSSEPWRFNNLSHPRSNTSLKVRRALARGSRFIRAEKKGLRHCRCESWLVELPTGHAGDIIPGILKRLWKPSKNKKTNDK